MNTLYRWSIDWGVPVAAVHDLMQRLGVGFDSPQGGANDGMSESAVQSRVRIEAARKGVVVWRNNVGAMQNPDTGQMVRYGLCNDSPELNKRIKSGDLIGIRPIQITQAHVGFVLGQFVSREVKEGGWKFSGTPREIAQAKWIEIILSHGGDAAFCSGEGSF